MCSPVLGWGEARWGAAAIAGERLPGGTPVVMAEGQEAAGGTGVQHARAVEEGEAALGQGSLQGTGRPCQWAALSRCCHFLTPTGPRSLCQSWPCGLIWPGSTPSPPTSPSNATYRPGLSSDPAPSLPAFLWSGPGLAPFRETEDLLIDKLRRESLVMAPHSLLSQAPPPRS